MAMPGTVSSSIDPSGLSLMPTLDILSLPRAIPLLSQSGHYLSVSKAQFRCWVGELNASVSGTLRDTTFLGAYTASGARLLA